MRWLQVRTSRSILCVGYDFQSFHERFGTAIVVDNNALTKAGSLVGEGMSKYSSISPIISDGSPSALVDICKSVRELSFDVGTFHFGVKLGCLLR